MSEHEVLALDTNFTNWRTERASGLTAIEPFLYYTVEHVTKIHNLTDEQVLYGITDHPNDGGIDALYCLAGRAATPIRDDSTVPLAGLDAIRIMIFQVKSSLSDTGFKPEEIDKFAFFIDYLLDVTNPKGNSSGGYTPQIRSLAAAFQRTYRAVVGMFPALNIEFYYVTRGDGVTLNREANEAKERVLRAVERHRGKGSAERVSFNAIDTSQLLDYVRRRRKRHRVLRWSGQPIPIEKAYVGMVKLVDYFDFLKSDQGELDELIFESNVRGSQGNTSVNRQMRKALDEGGSPDFWQLNNGVTITGANVNPIDSYSVCVEDAQVVNGLQTSRQVFGYFKDRGAVDDRRMVLVKLIPVTDDGVRDKIIRATNNQNPIKSSVLLLTGEIHRDIEELFKRHGLFYDRRPGFYKDQGKPISKIISFNEVTQAAIAILLHRPDDARARPGDYIGAPGAENRAGDKHNKHKLLFRPRKTSKPIELRAYLKCVLISQRVEEFLKSVDGLDYGDRRNLLFYVAYFVACKASATASPNVEDIFKIESHHISDADLTTAYETVESEYRRLAKSQENRDAVAKGTDLLSALKTKLPGRTRPESDTDNRTRKVRDVLRAAEFKW